jgi:hypothetical protein
LDHAKLLQSWASEFPTFPNSRYALRTEFFDVKTPFLMDAQAAKRARAFASTSLPPPSGFPERNADDDGVLGELGRVYLKAREVIEEVRTKLDDVFDEEVTVEDVEENNRAAMACARALLQSDLAESLTRKTWVSFSDFDRWPKYRPETIS